MRRYATVLASISIILFPALVMAAELRVGAAAVEINPPLGAPLAGYYSPRGCEGVLDDLQAKALVLEAGGDRAAIVICDLLGIPRETVEEARGMVEKETGIPGGRVLIAATHTHTGPSLVRGSGRSRIDDEGSRDISVRYTTELPAKIARAVAAAAKALEPAAASAAAGREDGLSFNRRFWMRDGTLSWNPPKRDPAIVRPAGPIDPEVGLLHLEGAEGKPIAAFVNFAMHPDTTGGARASADYPGALARRLAEYKGDGMVTVFANGACGNVNHRDIAWAAGQTSPAEARRIGTVLAGAVLKAYPALKPVGTATLLAASRTVALPLPKVAPEDIAAAREVEGRASDAKTTFAEKVKAFRDLDVAAREGKPIEVEVQVIALGDEVAWVALPGEVFVELGLTIKAASPFRRTFIVELANGPIGYIPNRPAYAEGNYEVLSARCGEGSGEMIAAAAISMLEELARWKR
jgi:neutral ceramidase